MEESCRNEKTGRKETEEKRESWEKGNGRKSCRNRKI